MEISTQQQHAGSNCTTSYNSPAGRILIHNILASNHPISIEPHDYQLDGICMSLDGHDVLATMATGAGKTGFFTFLMLVICAISKDSSLAIGTRIFPEDPAMIVICPTKALQADMVCHGTTGIHRLI